MTSCPFLFVVPAPGVLHGSAWLGEPTSRDSDDPRRPECPCGIGPPANGAAQPGGGARGGGGQREDHGEAAAGGVFGFHGAAHRLGQAAGYREAEPDAGSVAWVAEPAEGRSTDAKAE